MSASILQFHILVIILQTSGSYYKLAVILFRSSKYCLFLFPLPELLDFKENQEANCSSRQIYHLDIARAAVLQTLGQAGLLHIRYGFVTPKAGENLSYKKRDLRTAKVMPR